MTQAEMDFGIFATSCNHARRLNSPPTPDADGFFDREGVTIMCGRRQCAVEFISEFAALVQFKERKVPLTALGPDRWGAVSILKACRKAHGGVSYGVDESTAQIKNDGGLDEAKIARIVGADGLRPYLTRPGKHGRINDAHGIVLQRPFPEAMRREGWARVDNNGPPPAAPGMPTWAFLQILHGAREVGAKQNYNVRRALRALEDAGLMRIQLGPRGGMATAKCTWTERAYLPPPIVKPLAFNHDDDRALEEIAAGLA